MGAATNKTLEPDTKAYFFNIRGPDHDSDGVRLSDHVQRFFCHVFTPYQADLIGSRSQRHANGQPVDSHEPMVRKIRRPSDGKGGDCILIPRRLRPVSVCVAVCACAGQASFQQLLVCPWCHLRGGSPGWLMWLGWLACRRTRPRTRAQACVGI